MTSTTTTMSPLHSPSPEKYNNNSNLAHSFSRVRRAAAYCSAVVIVKMHNFFFFSFFSEGEWHFYCLIFLLSAASLAVAGISSLPWYRLCAPFCEAFTFTWNELLMHHHRLCLPALSRSECTNTSSRRAQHIYISHSWLHFTWFSHVHFGLLVRSLFSLALSLLLYAHSRVSMRAHCKHNITNHNSQMLCETH